MKFQELKGKDLMNIGIFGAIYFVIVFAVAMLGLIPVFLPLLAAIVPVVAGTPFMLFLTKVKKPGMIFIMGILMGIIMLLTGMGPWPILTAAISGILAEIAYAKSDYKSTKSAVLTSGLFSMWIWGNLLPIYINRDAYWASKQSYGQRYIDAVNSLMPGWTAPVLLATAFVCGIIGGVIGSRLLKKHFEKAGMI